VGVDRFYPWLAVDAATGEVNISFYDTRNDSTGQRFMTDVYFTRSTDGVSFSPNVRVSTVSSNEPDCGGIFPCSAIDYGNQYGDYEGIASFGGIRAPAAIGRPDRHCGASTLGWFCVGKLGNWALDASCPSIR
jgi:hypothetical protein